MEIADGGLGHELRSGKRRGAFDRSMLRLLLEDRPLRERFMARGGEFGPEDRLFIDRGTGELRQKEGSGEV